MKTRLFIAAVIALSAMAVAGPSFADHDASSNAPVAVSTKPRAEVRAELEQARAAGLLMNQGDHAGFYNEWSGAHGVAGSRYSGLTRDEVKAAAVAYMKNYNPHNDDMYGR